MLENLSDSEISELHNQITNHTLVNVGMDKPYLCGTVGNAIIKKVKPDRTPLGYSSNLLALILHILHDKSNSRKVYMICFYDEDGQLSENPLFGGHCVVLLKLANNLYCTLQSYMYMYELRDCHKFTRQYYTKKEILLILEKVRFLTTSTDGVDIPESAFQAWKILTGVDISYLKKYNVLLSAEIHYTYIKSKL